MTCGLALGCACAVTVLGSQCGVGYSPRWSVVAGDCCRLGVWRGPHGAVGALCAGATAWAAEGCRAGAVYRRFSLDVHVCGSGGVIPVASRAMSVCVAVDEDHRNGVPSAVRPSSCYDPGGGGASS